MRTQNIFFVVAGLVLACVSFLGLAGASIPYQDATPEMLEKQSLSVNLWWVALGGSFVLSGVGVRGLWKSRGK